MHPDNQTPQKPLYVPPRQAATIIRDRSGRPVTPARQTAAAEIVRSQIDKIYADDPNAQMPAETTTQPEPTPVASSAASTTPTEPTAAPQPLPAITRSFTPEKPTADEQKNPYERTHDESTLHTDQAAWQQYHSAWQNYYQQYFHRYYAGHLQATNAKLSEHVARIQELETRPASASLDQSSEEALSDLRSQIRHKVRVASTKVRKSRHFVPILSAVMVMAVFAFLQYNTVLFGAYEAYAKPATNDPAPSIVRPLSTVAPDDRSMLIVPKIGLEVPMIFDKTMGSTDTETYNRQMAAMKKGVAWFNIKGASARPGEVGNLVLSGHSSNDIFDDGAYKFVFARLDQLAKGDTIYTTYKGTRYTYAVTQKRVVLPNNVKALTNPVDKPVITLITCTPVGTAEKRLLVTAEQISPDPSGAKAATEAPEQSGSSMPGNSPTLLERMFGAQ